MILNDLVSEKLYERMQIEIREYQDFAFEGMETECSTGEEEEKDMQSNKFWKNDLLQEKSKLVLKYLQYFIL